MTKIENVAKLKSDIKKKNDFAETNKESAVEAVHNLSNAIENKEDLFLYCASLNYLNAYIKTGANKKQELVALLKEEFPNMKFKNGYGFKKFINVVITSILGNEFDDVNFERFPNENNLVMITINGLQFSYHGCFIYDSILEDVVKEEGKFKRGDSKKITGKKWEGLRLQPAAQDVFDFAMKLEGLSGIKYYELNKQNEEKPDSENDDGENE